MVAFAGVGLLPLEVGYHSVFLERFKRWVRNPVRFGRIEIRILRVVGVRRLGLRCWRRCRRSRRVLT